MLDGIFHFKFRYFQEDLQTKSGYSDLDRRESTVSSSSGSLNLLRVQKYSNSGRLKQLAKDNMPFMGLEIHGLEEIRIEPGLPHTAAMRHRGINIQVHVRTRKDIFRKKRLHFQNLDDLLSARLHDHHGRSHGHGPGGGGGDGSGGGGGSSSGSRRSSSVVGGVGKPGTSEAEARVEKEKSLVAAASSKLGIISERSDTQSVITEGSEENK